MKRRAAVMENVRSLLAKLEKIAEEHGDRVDVWIGTDCIEIEEVEYLPETNEEYEAVIIR